MNKLLSVPFIALALTPSWLGAQQDSRPLQVQEQQDKLNIAEQLYAQARSITNDPEQKNATLLRAAELFKGFATKYAKSPLRNRALYLQACALEEAGKHKESDAVLLGLFKNGKGEFAAAAAYRLGTQAYSRSAWSEAIRYYETAERESPPNDLKHDALYRLGNSQLQLGRHREAEITLQRLADMGGVRPQLTQACLLALAELKLRKREDEAAYALYRRLLGIKGIDDKARGLATLQAARLAAKLGKEAEAQELYDSMNGMQNVGDYTTEAHLDSLVHMYKQKNYSGVINLVNRNCPELSSPEREARRAIIVGQSYMELGEYNKAIDCFKLAEARALSETPEPARALAADAAYRHIVCAQYLQKNNILSLATSFLNRYALEGSSTQNLPLCDWVRYIYADRIMPSDQKEAAKQFDLINIDNLPENTRADALYKKAWVFSRSENYYPIDTLNTFISTYEKDKHIPHAYVMRGEAYAKQGNTDKALSDFNYVLTHYPNSEVVPACLQKAAQTSPKPEQRVEYYKQLVACKNNVTQAAKAEAYFNAARILCDPKKEGEEANEDIKQAIEYFQLARSIDPKRYGPLVDQHLVQSYFKLKEVEMLRDALLALKKTNPATYDAQPPAILRWCGWMCYQKKEYGNANEFLTDSVNHTSDSEEYRTPDGKTATRRKAEPLVWKCLAKSRLELGLYKEGYEAAQHYVSMETQPYRRAEGIRDMAQLLLGLNRADEARMRCEEAIAIGIDGPIKSALFITLGDTYYSIGNFNEAAKHYSRVANVVSDHELKALSTYKLYHALKHGGKTVEAEQYLNSLNNEFKDWAPTPLTKAFMESKSAPRP